MRTHVFDLLYWTACAIGSLCMLAASPVLAQTGTSPAPDNASAAADALKALDRQVEAAFQRGDTAFLKSVLGDDFRFWNRTRTVSGKADVLTNFGKPGNFLSRTLTSVEAEVHGTVAITNGRIEVRSAMPREYTVCYVRLYERRGGQWQLISHRTFREQNGFTETCFPE